MHVTSLNTAAARICAARHVACLTGAGISAESGVPTFRDAQQGLWSRFRPEELASQAGFAADPARVWRWYMDRLARVESVDPNPGHAALARLAQLVPAWSLLTQNVDDLHERAGSRDVIHLHGNLSRFRCNRCRAEHRLTDDERHTSQPPRCRRCDGLVRPDVVWFGEMLSPSILARAQQAVQECDVLLVAGTSGVVYPAAMLPHQARMAGAYVIDVNPERNAATDAADLHLQGPGGAILPQLAAAVADRA